MPDQPNESHIYFHTLLTASLLICLLDKLEGTRYYKGMLRNRCNMLIPELQNILDKDMISIIRHAPGADVTRLMLDQEKLVEEISMHYTHDFPILAGILQQYREDPENVLKMLDISIVPLNSE